MATSAADPPVAPSPSEVARDVFGDSLPAAVRYAQLLAGDGVLRGLIGPREVPRLWERHLVNCAVVERLLPSDACVADVGSGAGLPGVALAVVRSDLRVVLVEAMQRRVDFLRSAVQDLGLEQRVQIVHGRAEEAATVDAVGPVPWVTARAVAPLETLVRWSLPLLGENGSVLALKGERVGDEVSRSRSGLRRMGAAVESVQEISVGQDVTRVAVVRRVAMPGRRRRRDQHE